MSIVFFCVGAAKAGTSWLHRQLQGHPECHFRAIKELHYFNAIDGGFLKREFRKHQSWQEDLLMRVAKNGGAATTDQSKRLTDRAAWLDVLERQREDTTAYLDYLHSGVDQAKVVGEMTPAYALLSKERLSSMARLGPDVRFLFLMRDPVERLWSHVRMIAGRRDPSGQVTHERCAKLLDRTIGGAETEIVKRSDYRAAIERLKAVVQPSKLLIDVFEDMITGQGLTRLCDFLGIARVAGSPEPVYEGHALEMSPAQRKLATHWLAPQYAAAEAALGRRPDAWAHGGSL